MMNHNINFHKICLKQYVVYSIFLLKNNFQLIIKIGDHALCVDVSEIGITCYKPCIVIGCPLQTQVI